MEIILNKKKWIEKHRNELIKEIHAQDKKRIKASDGEFAFNDTEGRRYYRTIKTYGVYVERYGKGLEYLMWMSAGLTPEELDELVDVANEELAKGFKGTKSSPVVVGGVLREIQLRRHMIIHTELLYNYLACHYIRDDEDPAIFDQKIHDEKVEAFKNICKEGNTYDFFQVPELRAINDHLKLSKTEWEEQWSGSIREQKELKRRTKIMKSGLKLGREIGTPGRP